MGEGGGKWGRVVVGSEFEFEGVVRCGVVWL